MNWWLVADLVIAIVVFPFYTCFVVDMCSQAYFDNKLNYQSRYFDVVDMIQEKK